MSFNTDIVTGTMTQKFLDKVILYEGRAMTILDFLRRLKAEGWTVKETKKLPRSWGRTKLPLTTFDQDVHYEVNLTPVVAYKAVKPRTHEELTITKTEYFVFQSL